MYERANVGLQPSRTYQAAQWLLIWPIVCAIVLFASLNPVTCLIYCAAQSQHDASTLRPTDAYFCIMDELGDFTSELTNQQGSRDPATFVPRAVHELILLPLLVVTAALAWLYTIVPLRFRSPFVSAVPPSPPPKFGYLQLT